MKINNGRLVSNTTLIEAQCNCGGGLQSIPNGFYSEIYVCFDCESAYELALRKIPKKNLYGKALKKKIEFEKAKSEWIKENKYK